jgi:hypothetical protein
MGSVGEVVECLSSKHKALSANSSIAKKKKVAQLFCHSNTKIPSLVTINISNCCPGETFNHSLSACHYRLRRQRFLKAI